MRMARGGFSEWLERSPEDSKVPVGIDILYGINAVSKYNQTDDRLA